MTNCQGLAGVLFGHKFMPIYTIQRPTKFNTAGFEGTAEDYARFMDSLSNKNYAGSICQRCGQKPDTGV